MLGYSLTPLVEVKQLKAGAAGVLNNRVLV